MKSSVTRRFPLISISLLVYCWRCPHIQAIEFFSAKASTSPNVINKISHSWLLNEIHMKPSAPGSFHNNYVLGCARLCMREDKCVSFMVNANSSHECRLHHVPTSDLDPFQPAEGFTSYDSCAAQWSPWEPWTACTVTCGRGTRRRSRTCLDTSPRASSSRMKSTQDEPCADFTCLPLATTCTELRDRGLVDSVLVDMAPDGSNPVKAFCDMALLGGVGVTVIGHNFQARTFIRDWPTLYSIRLTYNLPFDHVTSLIDQSQSCKQFIKWDCYLSLINNGKNVRMTGWYNRNGSDVSYFAGGDPSYVGCACGFSNTCDGGFTCNCDQNDGVWRTDEGWLTYKDDLPVTGFYAHDTNDHSEMGYHTIGKLLCWGRASS